ncbi:MAG: L-aspartate oxidase [Actinobacteria bacterium]|nr:L-aspartate oxidase [Actinomycetota bacterium]
MIQGYLINTCGIKKIHDFSDCIIVGSGIAGLSTAIRVSKYSKVKVLTKSNLSESTTWYAQGGIAAAVKKPDWWKTHYEDTIEAGQGLCDSAAVEKLVKSAPRMIEDLVELGIAFDITGGEISLTTEGGHTYPRVLHAGGDATGEEIEKKLVKYSGTFSNIDFFSEHLAVDIITDSGKAAGIIALDIKDNTTHIHPCSNIVIASGGIGQLYDVSTNPSISTGDGIAMAYRAGASIKDIEFIQFHPTVFKTNDGHLFLITEALRGEGAYLRDSNGRRFMVGKHPKAELAPRDIVVKEMVKVMSAQNLNFIFLDATHIPEKLLKVRFPNIIAKLKENGLNLGTDLIKVFPAAHYLNGGIKTDLKGRTDIGGLYACGETAATGAHGANRLASNSLIEGLVFGWEISRDIIKKIKNKNKPSSDRIIAKIKELAKSSSGSQNLTNPPPVNTAELVHGFRKMMSANVGILRDEKSLNNARQYIDCTLKKYLRPVLANKETIEFANMLTVGRLISKAALLRTESRGTHLRNDWPEKDDVNWKKHIILKNDNSHFELVE